MRALPLLTLLAHVAAGPAAAAGGELRVVATVPDLADIAAEIGGDLVEVHSIARGTENIHSVGLQPSDLIKVSKADLFLEVGLSLEHAFVPGLLRNARNRRIEPGEPGFVNCSEGWEAIEVPETISREAGADVHPMGNPHINLDPRAGRHFAGRILEGLVGVRPREHAYFEERHAAYLQELDEAARSWEPHAELFRGRKIVAYHRSFSYFALAYDLEVVATIESKPGVPPTASDLARVIARIEEEGVTVVLTARWSNDKSCRFVAEKTGARLVEVPEWVKAGASDSWIAMMTHLHETLADAFRPDGN